MVKFFWRNYGSMQSKSKSLNQEETNLYNAANSTLCPETMASISYGPEHFQLHLWRLLYSHGSGIRGL
ncbi:hypothetical protein CDL12_01582 [Handroanthus impetiginosus]|uniref:Uncharacterized protein n=1 Tax=Handroanthus impetiginosus TaxID=429701 RepID=A0A2G9I7D5_9LAMI|nr:hypothetical protein CDL12_01582 [Handroanthus impetiginosus]